MTERTGISKSYRKGEQAPEERTAVPGYSPEVGTRISAAIDAVGGRKNAAAIAGVSDDTIDKWKSGGTRPSFFGMKALAEAAGVSMDWLAGLEQGVADLTEEPDFVVRDATGATHVIEVKGPEGLAGRGEFVLLPRYEVRAGAGGGQVVHSEQVVDHLAFKRDWVLQRLRRDPADLILIEASGDSMADKIRHGDLLLVDTGVDRIHDHAIYALNIGGELMVKYVQRLVAGGCRIFSENTKYPPEDLTDQKLNELQVVGQVIWAGGVL